MVNCIVMIGKAKINRKNFFIILLLLFIHPRDLLCFQGSVNIPIGEVQLLVLFIARRYHVLHKIEIIILL
jgi:hypothetical protein